jgi:hypothetical protein
MKEQKHCADPVASQKGRRLHLIHSSKAIPPGFSCDVAIDPTLARQDFVREELRTLLQDDAPIAAVLATAHTDGGVGLSIIGVEPAHAELLANSLERLAARVRMQAALTHPGSKQGGSATVSTLCAIGFACLTFIVDAGWIDALLTLGAQAITSQLSRLHAWPAIIRTRTPLQNLSPTRQKNPHTD